MQMHRNPANGYRIGGGGIATDGPGYRNYNGGGFGWGHPPQSRRIDVFLEAGKLATEYLVSNGLLPPNLLNADWQNSFSKNQITGGGSEAVSRSGRRKFSDDYRSETGSRDVIRARRTMATVKNPAIELNRKIKRSSDKQGDGDSVSGCMEEQKSGKDQDQKAVSCDAGNKETTITSQQNEMCDEIAGIKTSVLEEKMDSLKNSNSGTDAMRIDDGNQECEKPVVREEHLDENNKKCANGNSSDLLTLIRFNKIPTRRRSSAPLPTMQVSGDEKQGLKHESGPKIEQVPSEDDQSFPQASPISVKESRTQKRSLQINDNIEAAKKPRDLASANPQENDYSSYTEEKQFLSSSSKICDISSMEVSNVNDYHGTNSVKQEPVSVDFDLTMDTSSDKEVEIIDLDCDSTQGDHNNSEQRDEAIFTDLGSFPDSMKRVSDMLQDGYGLMISELLEAGNGIPSSSVSTGVTSMHNQMSLPNEEEILGNDDSIYMSLGEIPISFVPVWDQQPSQGYHKHY